MRRTGTTIATVLLLLPPSILLGSCSDDGEGRAETRSGAESTEETQPGDASGGGSGGPVAEGPFPLPFGLAEVDGTVPIGRPAVYEFSRTADQEPMSVLRAAYRVEADDPVAAFEAWVGQLEEAELRLGEINVYGGEGGGDDFWLAASASASDYVDLQLWTTEEEPVLLVFLTARGGGGGTNVAASEVDAGEPPDSSLDWAERTEGGVLFTEQQTSIHLPVGTASLMPTVPVFGGTGGSFSVLSAEDGEVAVQALLDEATATSDHGEVRQPRRIEEAGTVTVTGGFVIPAGGWEFSVVSVQAEGDPVATVYVSSSAD